jgi:hypothetical protein
MFWLEIASCCNRTNFYESYTVWQLQTAQFRKLEKFPKFSENHP